jgi:hypothetical protein
VGNFRLLLLGILNLILTVNDTLRQQLRLCLLHSAGDPGATPSRRPVRAGPYAKQKVPDWTQPVVVRGLTTPSSWCTLPVPKH